MSQAVDVLIVGAGPIGLETAVACREAGLSTLVVEAGSIGNTIHRWTPQTRWFSSNERIAIAGVPLLTPDQSKCTREQYLNYLVGIARQFSIPVACYQRVESIVREPDRFLIATRGLNEHLKIAARFVVLATGGTDHPRRLQIPGEDLPHVEHRLREPIGYFGRRVLIIGGRNSAVEAALRLHHAGAQVSIAYRGGEFPSKSIKYWLYPELCSLIAQGRIAAHLARIPVAFTATHAVLASVNEPDSPDLQIPTDHVIVLIGFHQDKRIFENSGVELTGSAQSPVFDPVTMETNVPGLFVAGTAVAGTQSSSYKIFLENCHDHPARIVAKITGKPTASPLAQHSVSPGNFEPET